MAPLTALSLSTSGSQTRALIRTAQNVVELDLSSTLAKLALSTEKKRVGTYGRKFKTLSRNMKKIKVALQ